MKYLHFGMGRRGLATVVVLLAGLVAGACGGGEATSTPTRQPSPAPQPTARPSPTAATPTPAPQPTATPVPAAQQRDLRVALGVMEFDTWTPKLFTRRWLDPLYDNIIGADETAKLDQSGLATAWESSADLKTWTLKLRNNVIFHNGDRATAADVKWTFDFNTTGQGAHPVSKQLADSLSAIETPDDSTVVVRLKTVGFLFPKQWASPLSSANIPYLVPKRYMEPLGLEGFNKAPVGSGPFKMKKITVGTSLLYEAVDNHWYYKTPKFKTLEFMQIPEESTRSALLKSGRAEIIETSRAAGGDLKKAGFNAFVKEGASVGNIFIHQQHTQYAAGNPLGNVKVREALGISVDRQTIVDTFLKGLATTSMDYPVYSWDVSFKEKLPVPKFDPVRAKQLLKDAGYPDGFPLDVAIYPFTGLPEGPEIMEAIAVWWQNIGVKVTRVPMEYAAFQEQWFGQAMKRPTVSGVIYLANRPIASGVSGLGTKDSVSRVTEDAEMETLSKQWINAPNEDEYNRLGRLVQQEFNKKWPIIPLFEAGDTYAAEPKVVTSWNMGRFAYSLRINSVAAGK